MADVSCRISDDTSPSVPDRYHDSLPKHGINVSVLSTFKHSQLKECFFIKRPFLAIVNKEVSVYWGISDTSHGTELFRPSAIGIVTGLFALYIICCPQTVQKVGLYMIQSDKERFPVFFFGHLFLIIFFLCVFYLDIMMFCDESDCIHEWKSFLLHDKGDCIATTVTAEAMEKILCRRDREWACPFLVERTKPHQCRAFSWKFDVWAEDIFYGKFPDLANGRFTDHNAIKIFQQSMIDCPKYFGRQTLSGLIGLI